MADKIVHNHTPKSELEEHTLFDCFGKKDQNIKCEETECKDEKNESLLSKLHISDSSSSSSDEECKEGEKKKDKTLKEKADKKIEEDKVNINVKILEGIEKAEGLKGNIVEKKEEIKEKIGDRMEECKDKKEEKKLEEHKPDVKYEELVVVPQSSDHGTPPSCEVVVHPPEPSSEPEEKKGFIEKIKDKLPGGYKKAEDEYTAPPPPVAAHADAENENKEKKGIFEMIKEKLPGYNSKSEEEKKEKECD